MEDPTNIAREIKDRVSRSEVNKLAFNIATRMKEIDAYETSDHNRYECLYDAILDEFSAVGMSLFGDEGEPIRYKATAASLTE